MAGSSKRVRSSQYTLFLVLILPLLLAVVASANPETSTSNNNNNNIAVKPPVTPSTPDDDSSCELVEKCSLCDAMQRKNIPECAASGRVEIRHCTGTIDAGAGTRPLYSSCKRTKADEEFLMIRLQVIWVVIGTAAFVSARKQKVVSASLFDQRKLTAAQESAKRRRRDSSETARDNVEMVQMEETIPLTSSASNTVDVVV